MARTPRTSYNAFAKALHWIVVILLIGQFVSIWTAQLALKADKAAGEFALGVIDWHKTFGLVIFLVAALRLLWRWVGGLPEWAPGLADWEKKSAHATENWLYLLLFLMPLSGLAYSYTSAFPTQFFGLFEIPGMDERSPLWATVFYFAHVVMMYIFVAIFALHLGFVIRRSVFEKDNFIGRMLPGGQRSTDP